MANTINFSGLSSSIQWGDIVDATIEAEKARSLTPITAEIAKRAAQKDAWTKLNGLVETLNENARLVRRTGFGGFTANVPQSPITSRALLTANPSLNAVPGRYRVEVLQLADTAKIAGGAVADTTAAMNLTGDFTVNGAAIAITSADSLEAIRDKINAANTGTTPTGVTASVVKEGATAGRLVLTRDASGSAGITLVDGTGGMARELGFVDSRSKPVSSAVVAAAAALGLSVTPPPATIRIGGVVITVDLASESIASIAAKINAAGGSATVEAEAYGNETRYRLAVDGNVTAVVGDANSQAVIDALGMTAGTSGTVSQAMQTGVYTDASDAIATSSTLLAGLKLDGAATALAVGDAINIRGMRGDGTAVTIGLVVGATDTMQTLLDKINDATSGFGSGARPALASLGADGRIRLADSVGGASRLSLSLGVTHVDGSAGSLGVASIAVTGRSRELQQGKDAILRVDGRDITRSSNSITDALVGTTINLLTAEPGTTIDVSIDRDVNGGLGAVQKLADSYNAIRTFLDEQRKIDAPLYADTLLRGVVDSFTAALRTDVTTNTTYNKLAIAGVALDRFGILKIDADKLKTAMADKPLEIEALFGFSGVGAAFVAAADKATQFGIGTISAQLKNLNQTAIRLKTRETDAQKRLDYRREQLVA
jgi:flagellar hook-associated protein 2